MINIKKIILDILFPIYCLGCKKEGIYLCNDCLARIPLEEFFYCPICSRKSLRGEPHQACQKQSYLNGLLIAGDWKNKVLRHTVHNFKYKFVQKLKIPLGDILFRKIIKSNLLFSPYLTQNYFDYLIPIPLFKRRQLWRGFNQAELLAQEVANKINLPILNHTVIRIRHTSTQVGKKKKRRQRNIRGAFKVVIPALHQSAGQAPAGILNLSNKKILLIDDVVTTGSTMQEVARVLKSAGVQEVWGLAVARG